VKHSAMNGALNAMIWQVLLVLVFFCLWALAQAYGWRDTLRGALLLFAIVVAIIWNLVRVRR